MKPRSAWTRVFSSPTLSVRGSRPTAIRILSASIFCCLPSALKVTAIPDFVLSIFSTLAPVKKLMPRLRYARASSLEISSSSTGTRRGSISRIVTSASNERNIDANSTPTAPAPTTTSDLGISPSLRISILVRMRSRFKPWHHSRFRTGGQNNVLRLERLAIALREFDGEHAALSGAGELSVSFDGLDFILAHQELKTLGVL